MLCDTSLFEAIEHKLKNQDCEIKYTLEIYITFQCIVHDYTLINYIYQLKSLNMVRNKNSLLSSSLNFNCLI